MVGCKSSRRAGAREKVVVAPAVFCRLFFSLVIQMADSQRDKENKENKEKNEIKEKKEIG